jgi:hypothetical protein
MNFVDQKSFKSVEYWIDILRDVSMYAYEMSDQRTESHSNHGRMYGLGIENPV